MKRRTMFQMQRYRPYFPYHCMVCLIPCVLIYAYMTVNISDDIMAQVEWKRIGLILFSILRFIFSFLLFELRKYTFWRLVLYIFVTVIHALMVTYIFYVFCSNRVDFFHYVKKKNKADFLTTWSFDEPLFSGLNVSEFNVYEEIYSLDRNLFHCTGQTFYQTVVFRRYKEEDIAGEMSPYQRETYFAGIGESVSLYCGAVASYNPITVLWSFNKSPLRFNNSFRTTKTYIEERSTECEISSDLNVNFIEDTDFGNFYMFFGNLSIIC